MFKQTTSLVLSTKHIPPGQLQYPFRNDSVFGRAISSASRPPTSTGSSHDASPGVITFSSSLPEGLCLLMPEDKSSPIRLVHILPDGISWSPSWIDPITAYAISNKCEYILFHPKGEILSQFHSYEWGAARDLPSQDDIPTEEVESTVKLLADTDEPSDPDQVITVRLTSDEIYNLM